jgi:hypothetical protein
VLYDIAAIFMLIGGILGLVGGGLAGVGVAAAGSAAAGAAVGAIVIGVSLFLIALSIGFLVTGHFLWKGFNWARIVFIVLLALSALHQLFALATQDQKFMPALVLALNVVFLVVLFS